MIEIEIAVKSVGIPSKNKFEKDFVKVPGHSRSLTKRELVKVQHYR